MSDATQILSTIEAAVNRLGGAAAKKQEPLFRELLSILKRLETKGDNILNNISNLKLINQIKVKLERLIVDDKYKDELKTFARSFSDIQDLNNQYFAKFSAINKTKSTLNVLKNTAIETTITNLTETGLQAGVTDGLRKILLTNTTSGGSYSELTDQLRNYMLTNNTGEGALERYVKTFANTAINQFSAEYNKAIADDLGLEWYMYTGSLLDTSRPFCVKCVKKKYIHASEFQVILKGKFGDEGDVPISKTTGLPNGLMAGTNADNFPRRRGGWNCGHQLIAVATVSVPKNIQDEFYVTATYKTWAEKNGKEPKEVSPVPPTKEKPNNPAAIIRENNKAEIKKLEDRGIVFYDEVAAKWSEDVKVKNQDGKGAFFNPATNTIVIGGGERTKNEYYQKKIMLHEGGHALHFSKGIITLEKVSPEFKAYYDSLKEIIKGSESELDSLLWDLGYKNTEDATKLEQIGILHDTLGGLTKGNYGAGHSYRYYQDGNLSEMEVFAHSITLAKLENEYSSQTEVLKKLTDAMKAYGLKVLE